MKLAGAGLSLYKGENASHRLWEAQHTITGEKAPAGTLLGEPAQIRPLAFKQTRNRFTMRNAAAVVHGTKRSAVWLPPRCAED